MSFLEHVQSGVCKYAPRIVMHGTDGIGKSTLAACAPKPIFIPTEEGVRHLNVDKFPQPESFDDVMAMIAELFDHPGDYRTLVIDTIDSLERLIFAYVCKKYGAQTIDRADGGFARGFDRAVDTWVKLEEALDYLVKTRGIMVILIAHSTPSKYTDAEFGQFDVNDLAIHNKASCQLRAWADCVLYISKKMRVSEEHAAKGHQIAFGIGQNGGDRVIRCETGPSCSAKNRYNLPAEMPLSWEALSAGLSQFYGFDINAKENNYQKEM